MLHNRREAAKLLGISVSTLDNERNDGRIAFIQYRPNGKVMISDEAIRDYIERNTHNARPIPTYVQTYRKRRA